MGGGGAEMEPPEPPVDPPLRGYLSEMVSIGLNVQIIILWTGFSLSLS